MFEQTNIKYPTGIGFLFKDENVWEKFVFSKKKPDIDICL